MSVWAIAAAAGEGSRLGGGPKALVRLGGSPMLSHSLVVLAKAGGVEGIVVAAPAGHEDGIRSVAVSTVPATRVEVVTGGSTRQESVRRSLGAVPAAARRIVVHDAARPLVTVRLVDAALEALDHAARSIVAIPLTDTLKRAAGGFVGDTVSREGLFRAQTPQAFRADVFRAAHERAAADRFEATDDAALLERLGERVAIVAGDERNLKVTTVEDLVLAEALLRSARGGTER